MIKNKFISFFVVACLLCAFIGSALAATVEGQITDAEKKPIGQATVSVGDKFDFTDVDGRYRIKDVPEGSQKMVIKKESEVLKETNVEIKGPSVQKNEEVSN